MQPLTMRLFLHLALRVYLVGAVLGLVFGLFAWLILGGDLMVVLRGALLWPAHFGGVAQGIR
jgi:hypothetical protein